MLAGESSEVGMMHSYQWSFESGGSSGSRALGGAGSPTQRGLQIGSPSAAAASSSYSSRAYQPSAALSARMQLPCVVGVTILQPTLPEDEHPLVGILVDNTDQIVHIPSWPAVRLPIQVHSHTVLTLRLFRAAAVPSLQATPQFSPSADALVAGLQIPAGALLSQSSSVQCWCALSFDTHTLLSPLSQQSEDLTLAFEAAQHRAAVDLCSKVYVALKPLQSLSPAQHRSPPPRLMQVPEVSTASPHAKDLEMTFNALATSPSSWGPVAQQHQTLMQEVSNLRGEAAEEAARVRAYKEEASEVLSKLNSFQAEEVLEAQRLSAELSEAAFSTKSLQAERDRLAHFERLAGDGILRAGVVVSRLRERLASEQAAVEALREESADHHTFLRLNNAEWLEEVNRLKRQVLVSEQAAQLAKLESQERLRAAAAGGGNEVRSAELQDMRTMLQDFRQDVSALLEKTGAEMRSPQHDAIDVKDSLQQLLHLHKDLSTQTLNGEQEKVFMLQQSLREACHHRDSLLAEVRALSAQSEVLATQRSAEVSSLHGDVRSLQIQRQELLHQHDTERGRLEEELRATKLRHDEASEDRGAMSSQLQALTDRIEDLQRQKQLEASRSEELQDRLQTSQELASRHQSEHATLKSELRFVEVQLQEESQKHAREQAALQGELRSMQLLKEDAAEQQRLKQQSWEMDLQSLQQRLDTATQLRAAAQAEAAEARAITARVEDVRREKSAASDQVQMLQEKLQDAEAAAHRHSSDRLSLESELQNMQSQKVDLISQHASQQRSMQEELRSLRVQLDKACQHRDACDSDAKTLRTRIEDMLKGRCDDSQQLQQLQAKLRQTEDTVLEHGGKHMVLEAELRVLLLQKEELQQQLLDQQQRSVDGTSMAKGQLQVLLQERDELQSNCQTLRRQVEDLSLAQSQSTKDVQKLHLTLQQSEDTERRCNSDITALQQEVKALMQQKEDLILKQSVQSKSAAEDVQSFRLKLEEALHQRNASQAELRALTLKVQDLEDKRLRDEKFAGFGGQVLQNEELDQQQHLLKSAELRLQRLQEELDRESEDYAFQLHFGSFVEEQFAEFREKAEAREQQLVAREATSMEKTLDEVIALRSRLLAEETLREAHASALEDERKTIKHLREKQSLLQEELTDAHHHEAKELGQCQEYERMLADSEDREAAQNQELAVILSEHQQIMMEAEDEGISTPTVIPWRNSSHSSHWRSASTSQNGEAPHEGTLCGELGQEDGPSRRSSGPASTAGMAEALSRLRVAWPRHVSISEQRPKDDEDAASDDTGDLQTVSPALTAPGTGRLLNPHAQMTTPPPHLPLEDLEQRMQHLHGEAAQRIVIETIESPIASIASEATQILPATTSPTASAASHSEASATPAAGSPVLAKAMNSVHQASRSSPSAQATYSPSRARQPGAAMTGTQSSRARAVAQPPPPGAQAQGRQPSLKQQASNAHPILGAAAESQPLIRQRSSHGSLVDRPRAGSTMQGTPARTSRASISPPSDQRRPAALQVTPNPPAVVSRTSLKVMERKESNTRR